VPETIFHPAHDWNTIRDTMPLMYSTLTGIRSRSSIKLMMEQHITRVSEAPEEAFGWGCDHGQSVAGSGANFLRMSDGWLGKNYLQGYAARTATQMSGAATGLPGKVPILNCCFRIFSASSIPLIVIVAVSNRLNPSIGRTRCLMRR
jgi:hypothetical protein